MLIRRKRFMTKDLRQEYPRPQFERASFVNLNGKWKFEFDDDNQGIKNKWYNKGEFTKEIIVPYSFQCKMSGIDDQEFHDIVWYSTTFDLYDELRDKKVLLNFGAVDYKADLWINGEHMITHEGG